MTRKLETVVEGLAFGESPRWRDGALYFSDVHANRVGRLFPDGRHEFLTTFDGPVSGIGWLPDGRMLVVSMWDKKILRREPDDSFVTHADISSLATGHANDMIVRDDGVAFVGNFGFSLYPPEDPRPAVLARIDPNGSISVADEETYFPNGMVITPDGKTLILGESGGACLTAFDLAADGTLSNRREWAQFPMGAVPDGICLDAEGSFGQRRRIPQKCCASAKAERSSSAFGQGSWQRHACWAARTARPCTSAPPTALTRPSA